MVIELGAFFYISGSSLELFWFLNPIDIFCLETTIVDQKLGSTNKIKSRLKSNVH